MTVRRVLIYPDERLREVAQAVETFDNELTAALVDMAETMYQYRGIGLAATQVGLNSRFLVMDTGDDSSCDPDSEFAFPAASGQPRLEAFINPVIVSSTGRSRSEEGCLSIPDYRETITRNVDIEVEGFNWQGKPARVRASGLRAVCLQHEIDHLDGVLFIDHLSRIKQTFFKKWFQRNQERLKQLSE